MGVFSENPYLVKSFIYKCVNDPRLKEVEEVTPSSVTKRQWFNQDLRFPPERLYKNIQLRLRTELKTINPNIHQFPYGSLLIASQLPSTDDYEEKTANSPSPNTPQWEIWCQDFIRWQSSSFSFDDFLPPTLNNLSAPGHSVYSNPRQLDFPKSSWHIVSQTSNCHRTISIWNALSHSSLSPRAIPWASVWKFQNTCGKGIIELVATVNIALVLNTNRFLPKKGLLNPFNVTNAGTKTPLSDFPRGMRSSYGGVEEGEVVWWHTGPH